MNGDNDQIRRMRALLRDFKPLLDRLKDQRRQTASRFNVTEAFGVTRDELVHSQFIAYLLNPTERHDQGDVFLSLFLQCLGLVFFSGLDTGRQRKNRVSARRLWPC